MNNNNEFQYVVFDGKKYFVVPEEPTDGSYCAHCVFQKCDRCDRPEHFYFEACTQLATNRVCTKGFGIFKELECVETIINYERI